MSESVWIWYTSFKRKCYFNIFLVTYAWTEIATIQIEPSETVFHLYMDDIIDTLDFHIINFLDIRRH